MTVAKNVIVKTKYKMYTEIHEDLMMEAAV